MLLRFSHPVFVTGRVSGGPMRQYGMTLGEYVFRLVQGKKMGTEEWETLLRVYGRDTLERAYRRYVDGDQTPNSETSKDSENK